MAKLKAVFFLPLLDNDGRDLSQEITDLEIEMFATFLAFTRSGLVTGAYLMADGRRMDDELWSYFVVLEENRIPSCGKSLRDSKRTRPKSGSISNCSTIRSSISFRSSTHD